MTLLRKKAQQQRICNERTFEENDEKIESQKQI